MVVLSNVFVAAISLFPSNYASAFTVPLLSQAQTTVVSTRTINNAKLPNLYGTSTSVSMMPAIATSLSSFPAIPSIVRKAIFIGTALAFALNIRRILHPNIVKDPNRSEPLPTGKLGCPFFGNQVFIGSKKFGTGYFWHKMSKALGNPRVWMVYFMGRPGAVISGGEHVKKLLNSEFEDGGVVNGISPSGMLNKNCMLAEGDRKTHSYLRRLVGAALSPAAVTASVPNLINAAERQVDIMLSSGTVNSEVVCTDFTLEVAYKQILGLTLSENEIETFKQQVNQWIMGFADLRVVFNIFAKRSPAFRAKDYLVKKIEEKIDYLVENGPDESTVSGMVFATDSEESDSVELLNRKLSREQIIENSLLLILAGSETSASTLTNALLCLGLNRDKWNKLVIEQKDMQAKHGDEISRGLLDKECPYLDATIKEVMRIKPLSSGAPRTLKSTVVIDGHQIPKGWGVNWNVLNTHELDSITYKDDGSHMDVQKGFAPERWLDEATRPTTDFIPMGAGPRYCLGATLAYTEMKVFLSVLARRIDFSLATKDLVSGQDVVWKRMSIIPKPEDGVPIIVSACSKVVQNKEAALMLEI